jgi:hypothetical protein
MNLINTKVVIRKLDRSREEMNMSTVDEQNKKRIKTMNKIVKEENKVWETKQEVRFPDSGTERGINELYKMAGLPPPKKFAEDVVSEELDTGSEEGDPDSENVYEKTVGKPMPKPFDKKLKTPRTSDEYGHPTGEDPMAWVREIQIRAQQLLPKYDDQIIMDAKTYLNTIEARKFSTNWEASVNFNAGTMVAELLPDFSTPNVNGFYLHPSLKKKILEKLNSGTVFLRDSHSKAIRDIIGIITRGRDVKGKIEIKADVTDAKVSKILSKYPEKLGVSISGPGTGYCTECGKQVMGMTRCSTHPKAPIEVRKFDLAEISLTDTPAWETSRVKSYGSDK